MSVDGASEEGGQAPEQSGSPRLDPGAVGLGPGGGRVTPASVMVVDAHPAFVEGIKGAIASASDLLVIDRMSDVSAFAEEIGLRSPDVTLLSYDLLQARDAEASLALVRDAAGATRIVLMYERIDAHQAWRALHAGAVGLISRCAATDEFIIAIRQVLGDGTFLDSGIQEELASLARRDGDSTAVLLTRREQAILDLCANGLTTAQIADSLALSPSSIKASLHAIYQKLGVDDRPAAVAQAFRLGLIS
jgi:two-component system nitrate/nitrite response regulator NarL